MPSSAVYAQLSIAKQVSKTLGVELPSDITDELERADELVAKAAAISGAALTDAVLDAIAAGKDYRNDKHINALLLDNVLANQNIAAAARNRGNARAEAALVGSADTILAAWAAALEPHAVALAEAAAILPSDDLDDLGALKSADVDAYRHLGNAVHGRKVWTAALKGFQQIAAAAHLNITDKRLILTAADAGTLPPDPWILARNGLPLSLPTLGEYMERVATQQQQRHLDEQDEEQRTAVSV